MTPPTSSSPPGSIVVPSVPRSVAAVRRYAVSACAEASEEVRDTVALLVSEVATNALVHGTGDVEVGVSVRAGVLRVEVCDDGAALPQRRTAGPDAEGGRGLALVEALASAWGVEPRGSGKVVWFEVRT
ncbi:MAG: rsbU 8 [Frankiales bacterium]|nr:rsbU 8 [Frankiales bacterium]